jgi:hypothetical protein
MLQPIATYWEGHPTIFAGLAGALAALFGLSTVVQHSIADDMRKLWDGTLRAGPQEVGPAAAPTDLVYRVRSHPLYRGTADLLSHHVFPLFFGIVALAAVVLLVVGTANRAVFSAMSAVGITCPDAVDRPPDGPDGWDGIQFVNTSICQPTGVTLERGHTYHVSITLSKDWADASHPAGLAGFGSSENPWIFVPALPFRRVLRQPWFVTVARVGRRSPEYYPLTKATTEITPRRTGHLYLFVNDAVGIPPWQRYFYDNNKGTAIVRVTERAASATSPAVDHSATESARRGAME